MNQEQLKQESWEGFWVETFTGSQLIDGKWYEPKFGCDSLQLTIDYYEAQQRVTRQEERVAERMRCVEIISKIISKSQFIDQFDLLEEAQKLILNQEDND